MSHTSIGTVWVASLLGKVVVHDFYANVSHHLFILGLVWIGNHDPCEVGELLIMILVGSVVHR
jgi:hypothetical protein